MRYIFIRDILLVILIQGLVMAKTPAQVNASEKKKSMDERAALDKKQAVEKARLDDVLDRAAGQGKYGKKK